MTMVFAGGPTTRVFVDMVGRSWVWALLLALVVGCEQSPKGVVARPQDAGVDASGGVVDEVAWRAVPDRRGGALVRGPHDEALYVADEDNARLRILPLPLGSGAVRSVVLPGRPAQVLALADRVLVTVRDPGGLLSYVRASEGAPLELSLAQRVALPADAWGLAVTPDERTALVTSAWTRRVSAVDLAAGEVRWTTAVEREPRGVVVTADGERAYVTHLVGSAVTRIDDIRGSTPKVRRVELPPGRFSEPFATTRSRNPRLDASLAYAAVLSPDGARLLVPRHALGGLGWEAWFGRPVVDVLLTDDDSPLAPPRSRYTDPKRVRVGMDGPGPLGDSVQLPKFWMVQPRAAIYRPSTATLLVASEGHGWLTELDARALDPSLHPFYRYELHRRGAGGDRSGAPSGVALAGDEQVAFVWCRTTGDVARVALKPLGFAAGPEGEPTAATFFAVAADPLPEPAATGRRLFYDARSDGKQNAGMSEGLACAGCHPEGRDDGHVWMKIDSGAFRGGARAADDPWREAAILTRLETPGGSPRQTPMLAGRVALVAGPDQGVTARVESRTGEAQEGVVIFPVRRGDRRFFVIDRRVATRDTMSKYGPDWFPAGTFSISETWLPGAAAPDVVVTRYGRHPSTGKLTIKPF